MLKSSHMLDAPKMLKIQAIADSTARWGAIVFLGMLPFFLIPSAWVTVYQSKMFLVAVTLIIVPTAWIIARIIKGSIQIPKSFLLGAGAFLPAAYLISALSAGRGWTSFVGTGVEQDTVVAILLMYILFLSFALILSQNIRVLTYAIRALFAGGVVLILVQFFRIAFPEYSGFGGALPSAASSAIGSWHDLAIFLGLLLFFSIAFRNALGSGSTLWRRRLTWVSAGSAIFLLLINSPDVWLGVAIIGFLYGAYAWFDLKKSGDASQASIIQAIIPYIILVIFASVLSYSGTAIATKLPARLQFSQIEVRPSWQGTYEVSKQALNSTRELLVGSGPNTFTRAWGLYKPSQINATQFWNTDFYAGVGLIPTSLMSVGILGLLSWGVLIFSIFWGVGRFVRDVGPRTPAKIATGAVLAGILYLFIFNIIYVPGVPISALLFALLGILVALLLVERKIGVWTYSLNWEEIKPKFLSVGIIALSLMFVFGSVESLRALVSDTQVNRAILTYSTTSNLDTAARYNKYALTILGGNDRAHRTAVEIGLLKLKELLSGGKPTSEIGSLLQETLRTTLEHGVSAVAADSGNYRNWLALAQLYSELATGGIEGAARNSRDAYERALIENPTSPLPLLGLAQLDLASSDNEAALLHLNAALAIKSDFTAAHLLLSQLSARENKLEKAEEEAVTVVRLAPEDPIAWYNLGVVLYARKSYSDAAEALKRAIQLQKNYANALFVLGLTYYRLDRSSDAISLFSEVSALNPNDPAPKNAISDVKAGRDPFRERLAR